MPNTNNIENADYHFNRENSATAKRLSEMSDRQLFNRYFLPTNDNSWTPRDEAMKALSIKIPNSPRFKCEKVRSLSGPPLDYFVAGLNIDLMGWVTDGYKFNLANIMEDFELILGENWEHARTVARTKTTDIFIEEVLRFIEEHIQLGIDHIVGSTFEQQ